MIRKYTKSHKSSMPPIPKTERFNREGFMGHEFGIVMTQFVVGDLKQIVTIHCVSLCCSVLVYKKYAGIFPGC